jgi:hypothetical protein
MTTKEQIARLALQIDRLAAIIARLKKGGATAQTQIVDLGTKLDASTALVLTSQSETIVALGARDKVAADLATALSDLATALANDKADAVAIEVANTKATEQSTLAADLLVATQVATDAADASKVEVAAVRADLAALNETVAAEKVAADAAAAQDAIDLAALEAQAQAVTE